MTIEWTIMLLSTVIGFSEIIFWPSEYFVQYVCIRDYRVKRLINHEWIKADIWNLFISIVNYYKSILVYKIFTNVSAIKINFFYIIINGRIIKNTNNKNTISAKFIKFILASKMLREKLYFKLCDIKKNKFR